MTIGFPTWTDWTPKNTKPLNDGSVFTNVIKINVGKGNTNQYVGFFVPRCKPFMKEKNNEVEVVSTKENVHCYVYGTEDGSGSTVDIVGSNMD